MKICPRCGSDRVVSVSFRDDSLWICKACDYAGPVIEGDEELIIKIRKNYNEKLKEEKRISMKIIKKMSYL